MLKFFRLPFASSGDKVAIPDTPPVDGSINYTTGFDADYEADPVANPATYKDIPRTGVNQALFDITNAIKELQSDVQAWINPSLNGGTNVQYALGMRVRYTDGNVYESLSNANVALPTDPTHWALVDYASMTAHIINAIATSQTLQDVTASRAAGTVYQNLTAQTIKVWAQCTVSIPTGTYYTYAAKVGTTNPPTLQVAVIGGAAGVGIDVSDTLYFDVAPGEYYEIIFAGASSTGSSIAQWVERR